MRAVGYDAPWRGTTLSHADLLQRIVEKGRKISPLLEAPWLTKSIFRPDWLHAGDLGITAVFLGNLFFRAFAEPGYLEGGNRKARCAALWDKISVFYAENNVDDRLFSFTQLRVKPQGKGPKLKGPAACVRALVPFGSELADLMASIADTPFNRTLSHAARNLRLCYEALSRSAVFPAEAMQEHGRAFCLQYVSLGDYSEGPRLWKTTPKLHIFLHMLEDGSAPARYWTYRDEDFGGGAAQVARRRGGTRTATATSRNVLTRFQVRQPMLKLKRVS